MNSSTWRQVLDAILYFFAGLSLGALLWSDFSPKWLWFGLGVTGLIIWIGLFSWLVLRPFMREYK